ncbi:MAG: polysaccharide deacetylase [Oscillospiraceae bacterium]|nr:polysaccharide deacetylase [Oscillospiraceae bacterium]
MKRNLFFLAAMVLLLSATLIISGCAACSRDLTGSSIPPSSSVVPNPVPSTPPSTSSVPNSPSTPSSPSSGSSGSSARSDLPALAMSADFLQIGTLSNKSVLWGPGTHQDALGRSTACIGLQDQYGKYGAYFIAPETENTVTLSFDQGYENGYTVPILDALKDKGVRAIFFLTGHYVRSQPELVQRMIDEGHILGNHSDSHKVYCEELDIEKSFEDAKWMQDYLRDNFNYEMRLFRFPEGKFSEQSLALMQQMGYKSVFWSFAYSDWDPKKQPKPAEAMEKITKYLHPGEIMLLHSVSSTNAEIMPQLIDTIRDKGYTIAPFEAIDQPPATDLS